MKIHRSKYLIIFLILLTCCESFVDVGRPKTQTSTQAVFSDDLTATSTVRGIYHEMVRTGIASGQSSSLTFIGGVASDELKSYSTTLNEFYNNNVSITNSTNNSSLWSGPYKYIYYSNSILEGLANSSSITTATRKQLEGEAKFVRAFSLFYLTNLYGDVPIVLTTDYKVNSVLVRDPIEKVYEQIVKDLTEAQALLATDFQFTALERVRPTAWAASALLSRVFLYRGDWVRAESYATAVLNNSQFKIVTDLNSVFLKNSNEAIWQLMPVVAGSNTNEGSAFIPASATSLPTNASINNEVIATFESGDKRRSSWVASQTVSGTVIYYPTKYKIRQTGLAVTEYSMVLRVSELYLIRAEARARQNKFSEAMADIDVIRLRAGLPSVQISIPSPSQDNLRTAIEQERRVELLTEWGHRWLDLKRWNRADQVLQSIKTGWKSSATLYPVPQSELTNNPSLAPQNPGY